MAGVVYLSGSQGSTVPVGLMHGRIQVNSPAPHRPEEHAGKM